VLRSVPIEGAFGSQLERAIRAVRLEGVVDDPRPPREVFNPSHPDADERGVVKLPNIQMVEELVNLQSAQRSYEANLQAITASRDMAVRALRIGRIG
jgi:flagellar basal-body rod protein FlgC